MNAHSKSGGVQLYLNIIWHQHQPSYIDPIGDRLIGPWVRTHATKDYYDMAAMLAEYPDIHVTVNLTSSLLLQLDTYYVNRLGPFYNASTNRIDAGRFARDAAGTTDPWIDLALMPTSDFTDREKGYLYRNAWNAFGISEVQISRFPEYERLKHHFTIELRRGSETFTEQQMREVKFWFFLAHFDPDFLNGPVNLPDGSVCDLSDLVNRREGKYYLVRQVTEDDCNRIVAEAYKVMANILPVHRRLRYDRSTGAGQIEVITTPFYHPILPLIFDTDLARVPQPGDPMPRRFSFPDDARAQVARGVDYYRRHFGADPVGMWPAEGSVAMEVIPIFREYGIEWIATDQQILRKSQPHGLRHIHPYRVPAGEGDPWSDDPGIAVVFRDTELSDRIGFVYQNFKGDDAADDFIRRILAQIPDPGEEPRLLTVILDGENAWEWYRHDIDGKEFLHSLYAKLTRLQEDGSIKTVTMSEYLHGNSRRNVPPHRIGEMKTIRHLWPGSWIHANYDTWIGEEEENKAWEHLLMARQDLEELGIPRPDPLTPMPPAGTKEWYEYMAWESIYAAEGSDWFWWFGDDQIAPGGEEPWDEGFRAHLENMYRFAKKAGYRTEVPGFSSVLVPKDRPRERSVEHIGTMARGSEDRVRIRFVVDVRHIEVRETVYIVGNLEELGQWTPNLIRLYDDGTNGDEHPRDGIWSLEIDVPRGTEIRYKYTNSGFPGEWIPGEEFPAVHRSFLADGDTGELLIVRDVFGNPD